MRPAALWCAPVIMPISRRMRRVSDSCDQVVLSEERILTGSKVTHTNRSRAMRIITVFLVWLCVSISACATGATGNDPLSEEDTTNGLKQALTQSANAAVDKLGVTNGFLENPKVKIQLPGSLQKVEGVMRMLGMSKYPDGLITTMNRAAETAAAEAKPLLVSAVQEMPVEDARTILTGGDDAATQYFRSTTSDELSQKF